MSFRIQGNFLKTFFLHISSSASEKHSVKFCVVFFVMFQNLTCLSIREIMFNPFDDSLRGTLVELPHLIILTSFQVSHQS